VEGNIDGIIELMRTEANKTYYSTN